MQKVIVAAAVTVQAQNAIGCVGAIAVRTDAAGATAVGRYMSLNAWRCNA